MRHCENDSVVPVKQLKFNPDNAKELGDDAAVCSTSHFQEHAIGDINSPTVASLESVHGLSQNSTSRDGLSGNAIMGRRISVINF